MVAPAAPGPLHAAAARSLSLLHLRTRHAYAAAFWAGTGALGSANRLRTRLATGRSPWAEPVACSACVLDTRIWNVAVGRDGLCNHCRAFRERFDPARNRRSLERFVDGADLSPGADPRVLVAVSGGKDSVSALIVSVKRLGLTPLAVTVQSGFIPPEVLAGTRRICEQLGVEHRALSIDLAPEVRRALRTRLLNPWPCHACFDHMSERLVAICRREGIGRIVLGMRYLWDPDFDVVTTARYAFRHFRAPARAAADVQVLNVLPALGLTEADQYALLDEHGWHRPSIPGTGSNCLVHGFAERLFHERFGWYWEGHRLLSQEIRAGFFDRDEALAKLVPPALTPAIEARVRAIASGAEPPYGVG